MSHSSQYRVIHSILMPQSTHLVWQGKPCASLALLQTTHSDELLFPPTFGKTQYLSPTAVNKPRNIFLSYFNNILAIKLRQFFSGSQVSLNAGFNRTACICTIATWATAAFFQQVNNIFTTLNLLKQLGQGTLHDRPESKVQFRKVHTHHRWLLVKEVIPLNVY